MLRRIRKNENISITLATLELILRKLRDCADGLPVLKSGVSAAITILEMSRKPKTNKKACKELALHVGKIVENIWHQTKNYEGRLPKELGESIEQIEQLLKDIILFMKKIEEESFFKRFSRQDMHRDQLQKYDKMLSRAMDQLDVNLQLSALR